MLKALLAHASFAAAHEIHQTTAKQNADETQHFDVKVGDQILIDVESNNSTGYTWMVTPETHDVYTSQVSEEF